MFARQQTIIKIQAHQNLAFSRSRIICKKLPHCQSWPLTLTLVPRCASKQCLQLQTACVGNGNKIGERSEVQRSNTSKHTHIYIYMTIYIYFKNPKVYASCSVPT